MNLITFYFAALVDLEEEDSGVPTRKEIKRRSQALVDQFSSQFPQL
jgi:hypothetical protein